MRDRDQLYQRLIHHALPPFRELARWVRALDDAVRVARTGHSFTQVALEHGAYPGNESRAISELLGVEWENIRGDAAASIVLARMAQRFIQLSNLYARRPASWRRHAQ